MTNLEVNIGGIVLPNPVMPASGTFSEGMGQVFDLNCLGAIVLKTITRELRTGNPLPRVAETSHGLLNSIGIPSKGISDFINNTLPYYQQFTSPLIVSISAPTPEGFASLAQEMSIEGVAGLEVNLSCPNLEENGNTFAATAGSAESVVRLVRQSTELPLWVKLSPNTGDITDVAKAAEHGGADALVVANTILGMSIDSKRRVPQLGNILGGLSGPAVKPIILRQVYQCARAVTIPVIGCGGISNTEDAVEYLLAGASAVQIGTISFIHPATIPQIVEGLHIYCQEHGYARVTDLIGDLQHHESAFHTH